MATMSEFGKKLIELLDQYGYFAPEQAQAAGQTGHVWIDGPDGPGYHCAVCGASRCNDYGATCKEFVGNMTWKTPQYVDSYYEGLERQWREYLEKQYCTYTPDGDEGARQTSCGVRDRHYYSSFDFCPYCGKRIVVEEIVLVEES